MELSQILRCRKLLNLINPTKEFESKVYTLPNVLDSVLCLQQWSMYEDELYLKDLVNLLVVVLRTLVIDYVL